VDQPGVLAGEAVSFQVTRELGIEYKTAWTNLMKLREAITAERERLLLEEIVEVDGLYIGGHVRPANRIEDSVDRRLAKHSSPRRHRRAPSQRPHRDGGRQGGPRRWPRASSGNLTGPRSSSPTSIRRMTCCTQCTRPSSG
jgi:hypothetical protein